MRNEANLLIQTENLVPRELCNQRSFGMSGALMSMACVVDGPEEGANEYALT